MQLPQIRLLPPTLLTVSTLSSGVAGLGWTGMPNALSYNVYAGPSPGGEAGSPVGNFTGTTGAISGLSFGANYYFKVSAVYATGESALSNELGYFSSGAGPGGSQTHVDTGVVNAGFGPYTLSHTYIAGTITVCLNGIEQLASNWSITGTALTFSGLDMTYYDNWSVRGNY